MTDILKLQKDLKLKFKNKFLLKNAMTHKSANQKINNEKLEFLGDRVLGLVLSKKLVDLYPKENEGVLDKRFAKLVNKKTCCEIALKINLQKFIILGDSKKKIDKRDEKILSDCCEALIGAVFTDKGFNFAEKFILNIWKDHINKSSVTILDSKTKLQEYSLRYYKKLPIYKFISAVGPKHKPIYKISVSIAGSKNFVGSGKSKQQAEQDGAFKLLKENNIT